MNKRVSPDAIDGGMDWTRWARSVKGLKLKISSNHRYLTRQDGEPFFYLGDTAWTLFKRLSREEVEEYLQNRLAKGFTVIQAYVLRGLNARNYYGERTLIDGDPTKLNEEFFQNVDFVVNRANELGLTMGLVTCHGPHVSASPASGLQVFDTSNAFIFGKLLGARYTDNAVIWLLGGDKAAKGYEPTWSAMAKGLKHGSEGTHLVSYHGPGPKRGPDGDIDYSSSFWFHQADWLDFNMIQSGHRWGTKTYEFIGHDYVLTPTKPTIDMEARYEDHLDGPNLNRRMDAHQEREAAYWAMLAGAAGHGYGCNNMWQFYDPQRMPAPDDRSFPFSDHPGTMHWREAMDVPGAYSMGLLRKLFLLRPWHKLAPDLSVIASGQGEEKSQIGEEQDHIQAARATDGSFVMAYLPFGNQIGVRMDKIAAKTVKAQWFDPRTGAWIAIGSYPNAGQRQFVAPSHGEREDWVLVLEDASSNYPTELEK